MSSNKGQIFSTDLLTAVVVGLIALVFLTFSWGAFKVRLYESDAAQELEGRAQTISEMLVKTGGAPTSWENNPVGGVSGLGLASSPRIISKGKVQALKRLGYDDIRRLLGIDSEDVTITLSGVDGERFMNVGRSCECEYSAKSTRTVTYEGGVAFLKVGLSRNLPQGRLIT